MVDHISNKAVPLAKRERAANTARRLLSLSREPELEGPLGEMCRRLALDALTLAEREITTEERAAIQRKLDAVNAVLEVKS